MSCLKCISKGLEADSSFTCLWLLYLPLYRRHTSTKSESSDAHKVAESCLSHSRPCYQLWLTAIQLQPDWQVRSTLLQRGILALAQTKPGDHKGVSSKEKADWAVMRSSCMLDLALRLLLLWSSVEVHDVAANWVGELVKLAAQGKVAAPSSSIGEGQFQPLPFCTPCNATTEAFVCVQQPRSLFNSILPGRAPCVKQNYSGSGLSSACDYEGFVLKVGCMSMTSSPPKSYLPALLRALAQDLVYFRSQIWIVCSYLFKSKLIGLLKACGPCRSPHNGGACTWACCSSGPVVAAPPASSQFGCAVDSVCTCFSL